VIGNIRPPHIVGKTDAEKLMQIKNYLNQLAEQINLELQNSFLSVYDQELYMRRIEDEIAKLRQEVETLQHKINVMQKAGGN
jgi:archaellum component FlaC